MALVKAAYQPRGLYTALHVLIQVFQGPIQEGAKKILKDATCKFWGGAL